MFAENCMKMKENWTERGREGRVTPWSATGRTQYLILVDCADEYFHGLCGDIFN